jgi:hypothetical protein
LFRSVSPWADLTLHEVCAACGREIEGLGFVILDYEELGASCDQDCRDKLFRSHLHEEEGTLSASQWTPEETAVVVHSARSRRRVAAALYAAAQSFAINSACSSTVCVAFSCLSGG